MKKTLLSIFIISVLSVPITVRAGELDGKALLCNKDTKPALPFGVLFENGFARKVIIEGYKTYTTKGNIYDLRGTDFVYINGVKLNRETLEFGLAQCELSTKEKVFSTLQAVIDKAKKKNKI